MELHSANADVSIDAEIGGRVSSLKVFNRELLVARAPDPLHWGSYPMAPWAGRIRHGRFSHAGDHSLALTMPPHAIHGTVWDRAWEVVDDRTLRISLGHGWPFAGHAEQCFELSDEGLKMQLSVFAADEPFPASIGWHPWFRRDIGAGRNAILSFCARSMYEVDAEQIPTGNLRSPSARPWDDCFRDLHSDPSIEWPGILSLTLRSNLDHWVVYDQPEHAICVEPMSGPPDALNQAPRLVTPDNPLIGEFELLWRPLSSSP